MRRTFCRLCSACVAIMRSWILSRTASAVATHQSCGVAEPSGRARVEIRCRLITVLNCSTAESFEAALPLLTGLATDLAGMLVSYITSHAKHTGKAEMGDGCWTKVIGSRLAIAGPISPVIET